MLRSHSIDTHAAATILGCTVQHVRLLIRQGKLKGEKFGRDWVAESSSVAQYLKSLRRRTKNNSTSPKAALKTRVELRTRQVATPEPTRIGLFPEVPSEVEVVNVASVPQRSPFRYPGGKTWLIPVARKWLDSLSTTPALLVEPFAGGAGIGLMAAFEGKANSTLLVELDPDVAAVWRVILSRSSSLLRQRIVSFVCTAENAKEVLAGSSKKDIDRAFQTIVRNRVSRGGILAPGAGLVKTGEANKGIASRWYPETLARRVKAIYDLRAHITFREDDGLAVLKEYAKNKRAAFFLDPPYPVAGKRLYKCHDLDHRKLFESMKRLTGPFLATYDDNPLIRSLADEFGFAWGLIPMKSTHHRKKYEIIISRDLSWLELGSANFISSVSAGH